MEIKPEEVEAVLREMVAACPALGDPKKLMPLASEVMRQTNDLIRTIESRITEAGKIPGDVVAALMVEGAVNAVLADLPEADERRKLRAAGAAVGNLIARKYGEKIQEALSKEQGKN